MKGTGQQSLTSGTLQRAAGGLREAGGKAQAIEDAVYDLKAVNPNKKAEVDSRTPTQLLDLIESNGREVAAAVVALRGMS